MDATVFNYDTLAQRLRELAFLNKGLKITLTDERADPEKTAEFQLQRRYRRVHQAAQQRQAGAAREAHPLRGRARTAERRDAHHGSGAAVQRRLLREHFSFANNINTVDGGTHLTGFRTRAHAHHQCVRPAAGPVQGRQGESDRRRRARRPHRGGQREGAAAAVRRPDQGQAQQRHRRLRDAVRQREAGRVLRQEPDGEAARSSARRSKRRARARRRARPAI